MPEKEGWDGLPISAVSCKKIVEIWGGEGLLGAAVTIQKIIYIGGTII